MANSFKIVIVAILMFAATVALGARGQRSSSGPMCPLAMVAADDASSSTIVAPSTQPAGSSPVFYAPQRSWRSWLLFPLGVYTVPVVILLVIFFFKHRRQRMMHETLRAMIEKGMPVTPELVATLKSPSDVRGHLMCYLLPGLILLAIGIGLMVNNGRGGLIPLLIGVAFLIAWRVEKRSSNPNQPPGE